MHVSNLCNFKCPNCHVFELGDNVLPNKVMSQEVFDKSILTFLKILKSRNTDEAVISIYGGETLANKKVIKEGLLKFGNHYEGIKLKWVMNTNGSLLKDEDVLFFKTNNLEIHLSIDGKEEVHNLSRPTHKGKGTFHMVVPALEMIKKYQAPAQINSYMMPSNYNHLCDLVDIAYSYGISKIYLDQFYNLDMITHKVGMDKYREVYLYGMNQGVQISGPWMRVLKNIQKGESREETLKRFISLDVNIDGTCYFPILSESKAFNYHIDMLYDFMKNAGWEYIADKTLKRSQKECEKCTLYKTCNGLAIEQVHYHIGLEAETGVSCDFYRDWISFLNRSIYFRKYPKVDYISVINLDEIENNIKKIEKEIIILEKKLWPLNQRVTVNIVEYFEELLMASKKNSLPAWATAIAGESVLYLKGKKLSPSIRHELTHLFLNQEKLKLPQWFAEGVCEWIQESSLDYNKLSYFLTHDNLFNRIKVSGENDLYLMSTHKEIPENNALYIQAHAFVLYLESLLGKDILKHLILATAEVDLSTAICEFTGSELLEIQTEFENCYKLKKVS